MSLPAVSPSVATIDQLMPVLASCTKNALTKENVEKILTVVDKNLSISSTEARKIEGKDEGIERSFLISKGGECVILMTRTRVNGDNTLSEDSCKTVKFCVNRKTGEKKVLGVSRDASRTHRISNSEAWENLSREESFLELFRGEEEFVRFDFSVKIDHKIYFVMEYCNRGDLFNIVKYKRPPLGGLLYAIRDYLTGLVKMHAKGVLHRDLKMENFLVYQSALNQPLRGKIADMGHACYMTDEVAKQAFCGTEMWYPRERARVICMYHRESPTGKAAMAAATTPAGDVFAMGCILYAIISRTVFHFQEEVEGIAYMSDGDVQHELKGHYPSIDTEFRDLIAKMVCFYPEHRYTAQQALDHFNTKIFSK